LSDTESERFQEVMERLSDVFDGSPPKVGKLWAAHVKEHGADGDAFLARLRADGVVNSEQLRLLQERAGIALSDPSTWSEDDKVTASQRFQLLGVLGAGAMGEVQLARDERLGRTVALKVMKGDLAANKGLLGRFVLEAQVSAQLDHPNIVPVYTLERTDDAAVGFSMKLVQGTELEGFIEVCRAQEAAGELDEDHRLEGRLEVFLKVCDAMAYAHARGVIHRDLKPENIMIGTHGEVYVMDWGIARLWGRPEDPGILAMQALDWGDDGPGRTQVGMAIGTPSFMSPEQAQGLNDELEPRSDQYSLGLILFELVTLKRANAGPTAMVTTLRAQEAEKESYSHIRGRSIPRELGAIADKATSFKPVDRYDGVDELADDIRRFMRREATHAMPDNLVRRLVRWVGRNAGKTAVGFMTIILAAVIAAAGVVVTSLGAVVETQRRSAAQEHRMANLVTVVNRRAHAIDMEMFDHASLAEQVGVSAVRMLEQDPKRSTDKYYTLADLWDDKGPMDFAKSEKYDQRVSFGYPVNVGAPDAPIESLVDDMRRLAPIRHDMRMVFAGGYGDEPPGRSAPRLRAAVEKGAVPMPYVTLGLESGLMVSYPANEVYSPEFDTRKRPWYTMVKGKHGAQFGPPVPDESGLGSLVPVSVPLYDRQGTFIGVSNMANGLKYLVHRLDIDDLAVQTGGYLVEPGGRVVVQTGDEQDKRTGVFDHGNKADPMPPFPEQDLRDVIVAKQPAGTLRTDDSILVFSRLESLGWYYVVRVDAAEFDVWEP